VLDSRSRKRQNGLGEITAVSRISCAKNKIGSLLRRDEKLFQSSNTEVVLGCTIADAGAAPGRSRRPGQDGVLSRSETPAGPRESACIPELCERNGVPRLTEKFLQEIYTLLGY